MSRHGFDCQPTSIDLNQEAFSTAGDNSITFGSGPFSLSAGGVCTLTVALFCSDSYEDLVTDAHYVSFAGWWPEIESALGSSGGNPNYALQITGPAAARISGQTEIASLYPGLIHRPRRSLNTPGIKAPAGTCCAWDHPVGQTFTWDTRSVPDGANYLLRAVAYGEDRERHWYTVLDHLLVVDNDINAQPEVALAVTLREGVIKDSPAVIFWRADDADTPTLAVELSFSRVPEGPFASLMSGDYPAGQHTFSWNCSDLPNGVDFYFRIRASDGNSDSVVTVGPLELWHETGVYPPSSFVHLSGSATPVFKLQVTDSTQLTGHTWTNSTFSNSLSKASGDTVRSLSLQDVTMAREVLTAYPVNAGESTPMFDGLKLTVNDSPAGIDSLGSGWQTPTSTTLVDWVGRTWSLDIPFVPAPIDVEIQWNATDTSLTGKWLWPGDTSLNDAARKEVVCPFRLVNPSDSSLVEAVVRHALTDSVWRPEREIVILTPPAYHPSTQYAKMVAVYFYLPASGPIVLPSAGDVYRVASFKPLTVDDVFQFTADHQYVLDARDELMPRMLTLHQNYPNPFNPSTTIRYGLPSRSRVTLTVFNTLGQQVATLVQGEQEAGYHEVLFDASRLASGVYLYRLQARDFTQVRRMLVLK